MSDDTNHAKDIAILVFILAFLATLVALCWPQKPETPRTDPKAVALAESLATARAEGKALRDENIALLDSLKRDSVVPVVVRKLRKAAPKWTPPPTTLPTDSTELDSTKTALVQCQETVREAARQIEGLAFSLDSSRGEIVQRDFDVAQCREALEDATRPRPFAAFSAGFGAGLLVGFGGCVGVR